jgi:starch-binding outer membrane protein, SusD/RagB family
MKKTTILAGLCVFGLTMSCSESSLDKINPNGVTLETYYNTDGELTAGVNSIYAIIQGNNLVSTEWYFTNDLRSDEMASGGGQLEAPRNQLLVGVNDPGNPLTRDVWSGWYRTIHRANLIIERAPVAKNASDAIKSRVIGEARFLRAWAYYELASLWGNVPIYKEFVKSVEQSNPKASQKEAYDLAISDLKAAEAVLPATYPARELGRATKAATQMLMARIYLQLGDYASAKTELQKIVDSKLYRLVDNYVDNTTEEGEFNAESIFEVVFAQSGGAYNWGSVDGDGAASQEESSRSQQYSAIHWRNVIPSNKILNEYELTSKGDAKNDPRFEYSYYKVGDKFNNGASTLTDSRVQGNASMVNGTSIKVSWRKYSVMYKVDNGYQQTGINMRIMRYADVLLMLAECENEAGNNAAAIRLMNEVRARKSVDMPPFPTSNYKCSNKDETLLAIQHERFIELAAEQTRNFDLIRWRKNNKLKAEPISYFVKNKHELLPIPQTEIDNNPKIEQADQNPGY